MVAQWNNSWLSIRAFCRQHGLAVSTFGLWRKRVDHDQPAVPETLTADTAFIAAATLHDYGKGKTLQNADANITLDRDTLDDIALGKLKLRELTASGKVTFDGNRGDKFRCSPCSTSSTSGS